MIKQNYQKILNKLITNSFAELEDYKIYILEKRIKPKAMVKYYPWARVILVNSKVRKAYSIPAFKGLLAHELGHFKIFKQNNWGWFNVSLDYIHYLLSPAYKREVENEVEKIVIKKGFKKQRDLSHNIKLK